MRDATRLLPPTGGSSDITPRARSPGFVSSGTLGRRDWRHTARSVAGNRYARDARSERGASGPQILLLATPEGAPPLAFFV